MSQTFGMISSFIFLLIGSVGVTLLIQLYFSYRQYKRQKAEFLELFGTNLNPKVERSEVVYLTALKNTLEKTFTPGLTFFLTATVTKSGKFFIAKFKVDGQEHSLSIPQSKMILVDDLQNGDCLVYLEFNTSFLCTYTPTTGISWEEVGNNIKSAMIIKP